MTKKVMSNVWGCLAVAVLIWLDQWTKKLAVLRLKDQEPFVIWDGVFELHYLENRGAAFGMMQGQRTMFLICTAVVLLLIVYFYNRMPMTKRFLPMRIIAVMLTAGAIGNLIDRVQLAYVVDFLYFKLIDFPIFNVADCYVTVGAIVMAALFLLFYKDEELDFLSFGKKNGGKKEI